MVMVFGYTFNEGCTGGRLAEDEEKKTALEK